MKLHKTKKIINLKEEIKKLKRRIEELEMHLRLSQKFGKDREKQVEELSKKLNESIQQVYILILHESFSFLLST